MYKTFGYVQCFLFFKIFATWQKKKKEKEVTNVTKDFFKKVPKIPHILRENIQKFLDVNDVFMNMNNLKSLINLYLEDMYNIF